MFRMVPHSTPIYLFSHQVKKERPGKETGEQPAVGGKLEERSVKER